MNMSFDYTLDSCPFCGDNIGDVKMLIHFDEDNYPISVEAMENAACSCGRIKVDAGEEYEIIEHFGEYPDVQIEAIGGRKITNTKICKRCKVEIPEKFAHIDANGETFCQECYTNLLRCSVCGEKTHTRKDRMCYRCSLQYTLCGHCGRIRRNDEMYSSRYQGEICVRCILELRKKCHSCGRIIKIESENYLKTEEGDTFCPDCYDDVVECECGQFYTHERNKCCD